MQNGMLKMKEITNIRIAGLGGMGVLKATLILGEVLFEEGFDVKKAEVHGMAQRGGSVSSDVRFGKRVKSPMIPGRSIICSRLSLSGRTLTRSICAMVE